MNSRIKSPRLRLRKGRARTGRALGGILGILMLAAIAGGCGAGASRSEISTLQVTPAETELSYFVLDDASLVPSDVQEFGTPNVDCCSRAVSVYQNTDGVLVRLTAVDPARPGTVPESRDIVWKRMGTAQITGRLPWDASVDVQIDTIATGAATSLSDELVAELADQLESEDLAVTDESGLPSLTGYELVSDRSSSAPVRSGRNGFIAYTGPDGRRLVIGFGRLAADVNSVLEVETDSEAIYAEIGGQLTALLPKNLRRDGQAEWVESGTIVTIRAPYDAAGLERLVLKAHAISDQEWLKVRQAVQSDMLSDPRLAMVDIGGVTVEARGGQDGIDPSVCVREDDSVSCARAYGIEPTWASMELNGEWWVVGVNSEPLTVTLTNDVKATTVITEEFFGFAAKVPAGLDRVSIVASGAQQLVGPHLIDGAQIIDSVLNDTIVRPES